MLSQSVVHRQEYGSNPLMKSRKDFWSSFSLQTCTVQENMSNTFLFKAAVGMMFLREIYAKLILDFWRWFQYPWLWAKHNDKEMFWWFLPIITFISLFPVLLFVFFSLQLHTNKIYWNGNDQYFCNYVNTTSPLKLLPFFTSQTSQTVKELHPFESCRNYFHVFDITGFRLTSLCFNLKLISHHFELCPSAAFDKNSHYFTWQQKKPKHL